MGVHGVGIPRRGPRALQVRRGVLPSPVARLVGVPGAQRHVQAVPREPALSGRSGLAGGGAAPPRGLVGHHPHRRHSLPCARVPDYRALFARGHCPLRRLYRAVRAACSRPRARAGVACRRGPDTCRACRLGGCGAPGRVRASWGFVYRVPRGPRLRGRQPRHRP